MSDLIISDMHIPITGRPRSSSLDADTIGRITKMKWRVLIVNLPDF